MAGLSERYRVRFARTPADVLAAQALRWRCFRDRGRQTNTEGVDSDAFDAGAIHLLVEERASGRLVSCCRMTPFASGSEIAGSYAAQFYGLSALAGYRGPMLEIGRFCIAEGNGDPDVLRLAWGAMTDFVDRHGIGIVFGCSSFRGTEVDTYADAFAFLKERHIAPRRWLPRVKAPSVFRFARKLRLRRPDLKAAMRAMPPLLRTYLLMGGWVSDHAVIDRDLDTLHVFTGLEIKAIPPGRVRALRALTVA